MVYYSAAVSDCPTMNLLTTNTSYYSNYRGIPLNDHLNEENTTSEYNLNNTSETASVMGPLAQAQDFLHCMLYILLSTHSTSEIGLPHNRKHLLSCVANSQTDGLALCMNVFSKCIHKYSRTSHFRLRTYGTI